METTLLAALAIAVACFVITLRFYEKRCARLQDDLDFAVALLAADPSDRVSDIGGAA